MSFKPLNYVLSALQKEKAWQEQQQFQRLLQFWAEAVGPVVSAQTRPIEISNRNVLRISTSSSVWAQNLAFERHRILEKLNPKLIRPLVDIQFSTRHWHNTPARNHSLKVRQPWQNHPSQISNPLFRSEQISSKDSSTAFQHWASLVQSRSRQLDYCPKCQCPTPSGELKRWSVCGICATQKWK